MAAIAGGGRGVAAAAAAAPTAAEQVLLDPQWPAEWPWRAEDHFQRYDESADAAFYESPRFVAHIDDAAIQSLTGYYAEVFPSSGSQNTALLDVCSSWISHYPPGYAAGRISGLGMNAEELKRNPVLSDYEVRDLNAEPVLPYADNTFDVVTNTVSVDYLTRPLEVFRETQRVLKPGGLAIMSFSNRCFPTKAVAVWTSTGDLDHCWIVGSYFHYAGGFEPPQSKEITRVGLLGNRGDPMYVVTARKLA
jgi:SAM-dependent methyltransferase